MFVYTNSAELDRRLLITRDSRANRSDNY